jgi:hypothetical protein
MQQKRLLTHSSHLYGLLAGIMLVCGVTSPMTAQSVESSDSIRDELRTMVENVAEADAYVYNARDSDGRVMDTAKIIEDPHGGYLAIYHSYIDGAFRVSVASSTDLLNWTFEEELGVMASQPYLVALPDGGFVAAWEQEPSNHLTFRYYSSRTDLLDGVVSRSFDAPHTLSDCAEGTPNIYSVELSPDIDHSTIDVGAHYYRDCDRDLQQRGTLTNFESWYTGVQNEFDEAVMQWGVEGSIGDRDAVLYKEYLFGMIEGQFVQGDWRTWRPFLVDYQTGNAEPLNILTHGGSTAFTNPTMTNLRAPNGENALVVTLFVPSEGAAPGESGQLIYYKTYDSPSCREMTISR